VNEGYKSKQRAELPNNPDNATHTLYIQRTSCLAFTRSRVQILTMELATLTVVLLGFSQSPQTHSSISN